MKIIKGLSSLALLGILLVYSSCGGGSDPAPPITDVQIDKLSKTWVIQSVQSSESGNQTTAYSGFTLTLSGTKGSTTFNYTTSSRPAKSVWPANGTFTFDANTPETKVTRNDPGDPIAVTYAVTDNQLEISFSYEGQGFDARTKVVSGDWTFTFVPQ
jgi:hypothetical protein